MLAWEFGERQMEGFPPIKLLNIHKYTGFHGLLRLMRFFSSLDAQSHWSESGVCTTHFVTSEPFKSGQKHNGVFL